MDYRNGRPLSPTGVLIPKVRAPRQHRRFADFGFGKVLISYGLGSEARIRGKECCGRLYRTPGSAHIPFPGSPAWSFFVNLAALYSERRRKPAMAINGRR